MPVGGVEEASGRVSQVGNCVLEERNYEHPVMNKSTDIHAGESLPEKGWARDQNGSLKNM